MLIVGLTTVLLLRAFAFALGTLYPNFGKNGRCETGGNFKKKHLIMHPNENVS
jgi:hypothetical protein